MTGICAGSNPACRLYYDVDAATGEPAGCDALDCYVDDYYQTATYDPRMRPWYASPRPPVVRSPLRHRTASRRRAGSGTQRYMAAQASPSLRAWSDIYVFSTDKLLGITAAWGFGAQGVVGLDLKLAAIEEIVAEGYADAEGAVAYVAAGDLLVACSEPNVALDGDGRQVAAADADSAVVRAAALYVAAHPELEGRADDLLDVDGRTYWLLKGGVRDDYGLDWTVVALHPTSCPAGYGLLGSECVLCIELTGDIGYSSAEGATTCDQCAAGYFPFQHPGGGTGCAKCQARADCSHVPIGDANTYRLGFFGGLTGITAET